MPVGRGRGLIAAGQSVERAQLDDGQAEPFGGRAQVAGTGRGDHGCGRRGGQVGREPADRCARRERQGCVGAGHPEDCQRRRHAEGQADRDGGPGLHMVAAEQGGDAGRQLGCLRARERRAVFDEHGRGGEARQQVADHRRHPFDTRSPV